MNQRNRIVLAFDEHYMRNGQVAFAAARHLMRQMAGLAEYSIFGRGRYHGPRFPTQYGKVRIAARQHGPFGQEPRAVEWLRRRLARFRLADARATWISNIEPSDETLMRWLFNADEINAVVVFTLKLDFALQIARLAHVFSTGSPPHIIVVTPQERADSATVRDLRWLQAKIVWDGTAVAGGTAPVSEGTINSRRMWLPNADERADGIARTLIPIPFDTPEPVSLLDADSYPGQLNVDDSGIDWRDWIGPGCRLPRRVRDIILFIRPDWMSCGSATLFESLAAHFRSRDGLLLDIAIWPYRDRFDGRERAAKVDEQQRHIRSALYFSLRRTTNVLHALRQLLYGCMFPPSTVANQVLILNALSAKPSILIQAVRRAKINLIYVNHYFTYLFARELIAGRPFFLDTHDIQSINYVHNGSVNPVTRRADPYHRLLAQEMRILRRAERLCFVNASELEIAAQYLPRQKLDFIIALPSIRRCAPRAMGRIPRLLTVASRNAANERNLLWLLNQVWPRVLDWQSTSDSAGSDPVLQLDICGSIKTAIRDPQWQWAKFHGLTEDLRGFYEQSDVVLLPVVTGGGVAIKTVEALLYGRPVVATRHALRGLPNSVIDAVGYFNDPEEFAQIILDLLDSPVLRQEFSDRSRRGADLLRQQGFYERLAKAMDAVRFDEMTPRDPLPSGADRFVRRGGGGVPAMADAIMIREAKPQAQPQTLAE